MKPQYKAVVIGASAGGLYAFKQIISVLPVDFFIPIIAVQHISPDSENYIITFLNNHSAITIKEADEKEKLKPGCVYFSAPNYHLLIEKDATLSLSTEQKVNYSRPSIDVMFETAADTFGKGVIGIILTGANQDGTAGIRAVKEAGGLTIVQDPTEAETPAMPKSAIEASAPDHIFSLDGIADFLLNLHQAHNKG